MANNYVQGSFLIPCNEDQRIIGVDAVERMRGLCCDEQEWAELVASKDTTDRLVVAILAEWGFVSYDKDELEDGVCFSGEYEIDPSGIWVYGDEWLDTEFAAKFTHVFMRFFNLEGFVIIRVAESCSSPRLDEFGGHCVFVTKDFIRWGKDDAFIMAEMAAYKNKEKHFVATVCGRISEMDVQANFLVMCHNSEEADVAVNEHLTLWRSNDVVEVTRTIQAVEPFDFQVLKSYLPIVGQSNAIQKTWQGN
jgi:hypothetical protein